jgi:hypothetical protein
MPEIAKTKFGSEVSMFRAKNSIFFKIVNLGQYLCFVYGMISAFSMFKKVWLAFGIMSPLCRGFAAALRLARM